MADVALSRGLALAGLVLLVALASAVATEQPPSVRLPLTLLVFFAVPGVAVAGAAGVERRAAWLTLVVSVSLAASALLSAALSLLGVLRPGVVAATFLLCCGPPLALRAVRSG